MKKNLITKILCLAMSALTLFALAGCNSSGTSRNVEGTWLCQDAEEPYGYTFYELMDTKDGKKMGHAYEVPKPFLSYTTYYYSFISDNEIEIITYSPSFSGGAVGMDESDREILRLETEDGKRVLISNDSGTKYYFVESEK